MIRVDRKAAPRNFNAQVRLKGQRFLQENPRPTSKQWQSHRYWREVMGELHEAYGGICAYSCHWIPYDTGADTVEHFLPKDLYPTKAYEWNNYRLVCATLNGRKGKYEDVLDPFRIQNGWFVIDFPSMQVKPNPSVASAKRQTIQNTIDRLGLNDEGTCLKSRVKWLKDYCSHDVSFAYLRRHAPFIVSEIERQNLLATIRNVFRT